MNGTALALTANVFPTLIIAALVSVSVLCLIALTPLQIASVALLVVLAAVCAYPYPGYEAGVIEGHGLPLEGHGLSLEGHGLALEGAGGLEGHAVADYSGHGGETEHDVQYYVIILI